MTSYEAAWFLGLTGGHAMLGFVVVVILGERWRRLARVAIAFGASAAANALLTVGLTLALLIQIGSGQVPLVLYAMFLVAFFTVVFNVVGLMGTLLGAVLGCLIPGSRPALHGG